MSPDAFHLYLFIVAGGTIFLALWALGVAAVAWDTARRGLRGPQRWLWVALPAVLPIAGALVYAMLRTGAHLAAADPFEGPATPAPRRFTQPMPETPSGGVRSTLPSREAPPTQVDPTPGTQAPWRLTVVAGPERGTSFDLRIFPVILGRSAAAAVCLSADLNVSRQHAEIYAAPGGLRLRDLSSRYGTQVNGAFIQDQALAPGDRVCVGATVLQLERHTG